MVLTGIVVGGVFGFLGMKYSQTLPTSRKWVALVLMATGVGGAIVLQRMLRHQLLVRMDWERDEQAAQEIQTRLRPAVLPEPPGLELAGFYRSFRHVGGDYYDTVMIDDRRLLVTIADVSGKGAAAALLTANLQAILKFVDLDERPLESVVSAINTHLCRHTESSRFITMVIGLIDLETRRLTYVNAGHNPAFLTRGGRVVKLEATSPPVGMLEDLKFPAAEFALEPGDMLVLYTDGLSERRNARGDFFDERGILAALEGNRLDSADEVVRSLVRDCEAFAQGEPAEDDTAILVIRTKAAWSAGG